MKAAAFDYLRAATIEEAAEASAGANTAVLAGGQSLVPLLNMRLARPSLLVDINHLTDLSYLRRDNGNLVIGAMTRHRAAETSALAGQDVPLLTAALGHVGHVSIRNRGTVGGSLAHADPAAELPAVAVALDASLRAQSAHGVRDIAARDFFVGPNRTALRPGELLVSVSFPVLQAGFSVQELAFRGQDLALVLVVAAVTVEDGHCTQARIAVGGAGPTPIRATSVEQALVGRALTDALITEAAAELSCDPPDSIHAPASYRREMATVLTRRAIRTAVHP
ncbi:FAD binding domain-containing protein [Kibdelosporangium phytohabitans]|uniref:Molybdopterin dehydrogenase n=1 Tax=Kibdelosporangium phytohabitans TaxID=860235 RepID=A0A0N9I0K6_9PSEU|nr:xanthine dehydrogenase family protein subunit M [Kibdelosporangium phytohabitans]ALG09538.1 molybdopterin dehydrogenase [Kibdelosporangium phytohabitans]MBE1469150.1 carbon-monoxide dehydrogenase medium subunit [Kibdelosporangium phytohabitans]